MLYPRQCANRPSRVFQEVTAIQLIQNRAEHFRNAQALCQRDEVAPARELLDNILVAHPMHPDAAALLAKAMMNSMPQAGYYRPLSR